MNANPQSEVERIIQARDFSALRGTVERWPAADLASLLDRLATEDQVIVFRILPSRHVVIRACLQSVQVLNKSGAEAASVNTFGFRVLTRSRP